MKQILPHSERMSSAAGVHIYCAVETPVYASSRLLAVHTAAGGKIKITLPRRRSKITELYSGVKQLRLCF